MSPTTRRHFLRLVSASGAGVVISGAAGTAQAAPPTGPRTRVYVLVVDGCRPDELTPTLTPRLARLRAAGTDFPAARSLPVTETIPNHVMMMTGVRPDRTGVPANSVYDRTEGVIRDLDRPTDLRFPTVIERLNATGATTGTVLSKAYLYGIFGGRATYRWEPSPLLPITDHAPDAATVEALIAMVDHADPDLVFANFGDIDRVGHSDLTGTTLRAARETALASTDTQIGRFVDHLHESGKWASSVVLVLADHSMDWSIPTNVISIDLILRARPDLRDRIRIAQNGGADLLYWTGETTSRDAGLTEIRDLVQVHPGVLAVHEPAQLRLGPEAGDLIATCRAGWRFSDPTPFSNPIPGNHGHEVTLGIPFFIAGGHRIVRRGQVVDRPVRTLDVAPTVARLFGLDHSGMDGRPALEAFHL